MRKIRSRSIVAMLLAAGLSAGPLAGGNQGRILGAVNDPEGEPVPGVEVTVRAAEFGFEKRETTDRKGRFSMVLVDASRSYVIRLEKEGYLPLEGPLEPEVGATLRATWTLEPARRSAAPSGPPAAPEGSAAGGAVGAYNEGAAALKAGEVEAATAKFEEALSLDPDLVPAYAILVDIYLDQERYEEGLHMAEELLARDTGNVLALRARYDALSALGRKEEAEEALAELLAVDRSRSTVARVFNTGAAAAREGDLGTAIARFEQAVRMEPGFVPGWAALAKVHLQRRNYEEALAAAGELGELDPGNADALLVRYEVYLATGRAAEADEVFAALRENDPGKAAGAPYRLGVGLFNEGRIDEAIEAFRDALEVDPSYAKAHYWLGLCFVNKSQPAEAEAHLRSFLEMAPDDPDAETAREMLGYLD